VSTLATVSTTVSPQAITSSAFNGTTTEVFKMAPRAELQWTDIVLIVIMGFISVLTIFGNLVVLFSYYLNKAIRQPSNYFIFSLAVSDLVFFVNNFIFYDVCSLI
jgi:muscarinic acetylcholine receptor